MQDITGDIVKEIEVPVEEKKETIREEKPKCLDECSTDSCFGFDYTECITKTDGCKAKKFRGKITGKWGVECTTDFNCDTDEECKNYKCVEKEQLRIKVVCDPSDCEKKDKHECIGTTKQTYDYYCYSNDLCTYNLKIEYKSVNCGYKPCDSTECDKKDKEECHGTTKRVYDYYCYSNDLCTYNLKIEYNSIDCGYEETPEEEPEEVSDLDNIVTRVIDGDTIEMDTGERVRLICIDTPEAGQPYYTEAKTYLTKLILNKEVKLEKDVSETDRYGRLLRYVYEGDTFVNGELVEKGYAKVYRYPSDTKFCGYLDYLEEDAKNKKLGIWSEAGEETAEPEYTCNYNAYDCNDFITHAQAQAVYEACGGVSNDVHRLDRDEDGLACESLP